MGAQVYVYVPPEMGKDQICQALKQINFAVRRDTYFKEMKRSNKSRKTQKRQSSHIGVKRTLFHNQGRLTPYRGV